MLIVRYINIILLAEEYNDRKRIYRKFAEKLAFRFFIFSTK